MTDPSGRAARLAELAKLEWLTVAEVAEWLDVVPALAAHLLGTYGVEIRMSSGAARARRADAEAVRQAMHLEVEELVASADGWLDGAVWPEMDPFPSSELER